MLEQAATASEAELDSLFVGDHHATGGPYYQNGPILGRLLAEWTGPRSAGALYLLPLWNPVLVAEQVGTLAALAPGPFILQCALGAGEEQFKAMGADMHRRAGTFELRLDTIRRLLAGDEIDGVRTGPLPPEPVDVWIGGTAPAAVDRAARLGDAWVAAPELVTEQAAELIALYRGRCAVHGKTPSTIAIRRDVHIGADEADAWRVAGPILDAGYRGFDAAAPVVGAADEVAGRFHELAELGFTDVIIRPLADDQAETLACLQRAGDVRAQLAG
jgi:alkanesulfonate monooxygenase SsuD/methylene tetrahydromethanopterin reductase-like flavin-dependent oxidoreductase (luciferase family)